MLKLGIYVQHLDEYGLTGPNVYLTRLVELLSKRSDVELYLIHHKSSQIKFPRELKHIFIPKIPLMGEIVSNKTELDIVHFNYIPWEYRCFFPILKPKKIATSHISIGWNGQNYSENHSEIRRIAEPLAAKFLDTIIAVSQDLKNRLIKYLRIHPSKIEVVYECINEEIFKPTEKNCHLVKTKRAYHITRPFIIHTSNFSLRKNPTTLFKSFKHVVDSGFEGDLLISGFGWKNSLSEQIVANLGLTSKVRFLGYISAKDLASLFNLARVAFFPSLHENFCFPIVEAMSCGTPVVASNSYSIPEIAGDAAILCSCGDNQGFAEAIQSILEDENKWEEMRKRGLNNSKRFSSQKSVERTMEVYKKTLNN